MHSRRLFVALGVVLIIAGCVVPQVLVFLAGALIFAAGIAAWGRWWTRLLTVVAVTAAIVAVPYLLGRFVANKDLGWDASGVQAVHASVGDTSYIEREDELQVVDTATGKTKWSRDDVDVWQVGHDGAVVTQTGLINAGGETVWDFADVMDEKPQLIIARNDGVTVFADGIEAVDTQTDITYTGIADSGEIAWRKKIDNSSMPSELRTPVRKQADQLISRSMVVAKHGANSSRTHVLDVATGRSIYDVKSDAKKSVQAVPTQDMVVLLERSRGGPCSATLVQGDQVAWEVTNDELCPGSDALLVKTRFADRIYFNAPTELIALDLADGTVQAFAQDADGPRLEVTSDAVIRLTEEKVTALDARSGDTLWERQVDIDSPQDLVSLDYVVAIEPTQSRNPLLRPRLSFDDGFSVRDDSRRVTVLDPTSGDELASIVDPWAVGHRTRYPTVDGGLFIVRDELKRGLFIPASPAAEQP